MTFQIGDLVEIKSIEECGFVHDRRIGMGKRNLYLIDDIQGEGFEWFRQDDLKLLIQFDANLGRCIPPQ